MLVSEGRLLVGVRDSRCEGEVERILARVYSPPMTGNRPESLGSHWGLETVKIGCRAGKNGREPEQSGRRVW